MGKHKRYRSGPTAYRVAWNFCNRIDGSCKTNIMLYERGLGKRGRICQKSSISEYYTGNLYDNLKLLIENLNLRKELGEKGRKYVEEVHDSKKIAEQLLQLYKGL